ncbi:RNA polymerase III transcription factor IIIC subunit-domain-containing protein [Aspergillus caelatus]|uniref:RNA polymerase III transcription factor IIIC subunit-domain-containing protein n=1 Tax=Aspergillus caelatus TaxID=61420 RepID=A0A5N6ZU36_9EURO|nr:RNA polymerase III transcription factor IIIC subunit-domain-containing protein [Aspergillus caelatus]KAE8361067.1 RNA polymerase III transcription factor IIIC subunit-domain-containing protein [Aspergillus caelatus]
MSEQPGPRTAPFYPIPSRRIVTVEHPAIIKNVDKAIDTLQGSTGISKILNPPKADTPAHLHLRPEDAMSRPVQSTSLPSNNILLKVTVPRRTGRKRKRGSDEPFTGVPVSTLGPEFQPRRSAKELMRSLRDNVGRYQIEPVGLVNRTHVFRGMPDFVFSSTGSSFANRFREQILPFDYEKMKQFNLDMAKGISSHVDIIPPPSFSQGDIPFTYAYRQNQAVRQSIDSSGNITTVNTQKPTKVLTHLVSYDVPEVPSKPNENTPPLETQDATLRETVSIIRDLFDKRPAWTRRGLRNNLSTIEQRYALRHAIPYVGYIMRSGPWRDAIIKFGHDPRTSPDYRAYQTVMFRILPKEADVARDGYAGRRHAVPRLNEPVPVDPSTDLKSDTHIFKGQLPLPLDGRMWMFCDITDPLLRNIVFPEEEAPEFIRETCDTVSDGWYGSGTLAKLKLIMRHKILGLIEERIPDDQDFARILRFPDYATPENVNTAFTLDASVVSTKELTMATEIRAMIKGTPSWRESTNQGQEQDATAKRGKGAAGRRVQWRDTAGEEESEGEEEAIEKQEILEAAVDEVMEAATTGGDDDGNDDLGESDGGEEIEELRPQRKSGSRR